MSIDGTTAGRRGGRGHKETVQPHSRFQHELAWTKGPATPPDNQRPHPVTACSQPACLPFVGSIHFTTSLATRHRIIIRTHARTHTPTPTTHLPPPPTPPQKKKNPTHQKQQLRTATSNNGITGKGSGRYLHSSKPSNCIDHSVFPCACLGHSPRNPSPAEPPNDRKARL